MQLLLVRLLEILLRLSAFRSQAGPAGLLKTNALELMSLFVNIVIEYVSGTDSIS